MCDRHCSYRFLSLSCARQVLHCIGNLFTGAKDIQHWLTTCARLIAKSIPPDRVVDTSDDSAASAGVVSPKKLAKEQMTSVIWTTPLGLPIVQPYRQIKRKQVMTQMQTVYISDPNVPSSGMTTTYAYVRLQRLMKRD